jgi:lipopolysaccharide export system permease protein
MNFLSVLKSQKSTIAKYLMGNVLTLFFAVFVVISIIISGNQLVLVIKDSIEAGIPIENLISVVGLNMLRDLPLILSLSLFLSIIIAINSLYKNSEAIVMNSIGVGDKSFMLYIQPIVIVIFSIILFLTNFAIPWSKEQKKEIIDRVENASEFSFIKEGEFQEFKGGNIVFFASNVNSIDGYNNQEMEDIFIRSLEDDKQIITLASEAQKYTDIDDNVYLRLIDGKRYYSFPSLENQKILKFDLYDLLIIDGDKVNYNNEYSDIDGKSTIDLIRDGGVRNIMELQWRLSQPFIVLILPLLAILLGKSSPRGGKSLGLLVGVAIFIVYNNVILLTKSSIERGEIPLFFGLWSVHLIVLFFIVIFYSYRNRKIHYYFDKTTQNFFSKG